MIKIFKKDQAEILDFCRISTIKPTINSAMQKNKEGIEYEWSKMARHIHKNNRVVYGKLKMVTPQEMPAKFSIPITYEVDIIDDPEYAEMAGYHPMYYSHWKPNSSVKITLKDRRKNKTGSEPNFFMTAVVNGCSIYIEGSRKHPTVYHMNAMGTTNKNKGTTYQRGLQDMRMNKWFYDHKRPKDKGPVVPARHISGLDYRTGEALQDKFKEDISKKIEVKNSFKEKRWISTQDDTRGTVFGILDGEEWSFYIQLWYFGTASYQTKKFFKKKARPQQITTFSYPLQVHEIWPGGDLSHATLSGTSKQIIKIS
jgi:hypothetical protein